MKNQMFDICFDLPSGGVSSICHVNDSYHMNWCKDNHVWGTIKGMDLVSCIEKDSCLTSVYINKKLKVTVNRYFNGSGNYCEDYTFENITESDVFFTKEQLGIYAPFNDSYPSSEICMHNRCHTHIWCGDNISYVNALKMGLSKINLGLFVIKGGLSGYSMERDFERHSNDRGIFILHPTPFSLKKGECYSLGWEIFWHTGTSDFFNQVRKYPGFVYPELSYYTFFYGEKISITAFLSKKAVYIKAYCDDESIPYSLKERSIKIEYAAKRLGEHKFVFVIDNIETFVRVNVVLPFQDLLKKRADFIVRKQQFHKAGSCVDGAFLIYDNEDQCQYFDNSNPDHNASRERLGMGIFLAKYLQNNQDEKTMHSLDQYEAFVKREIFDEDTGVVYDTVGKDKSNVRLYNAPWMATFWMEMFQLKKDDYYLKLMYRTIMHYYQIGGNNFYPNGLPMKESVRLLQSNNLTKEASLLLNCYRDHVDMIIENGIDYPKHEVNFEQTIVTPVLLYLTQMYQLINDERYRKEARNHIGILERFDGMQPDYHLNEIPIRHWDDYWFGKRRLFGDTFPHYWSCLSAAAYKYYSDITGDKQYLTKAFRTMRGCLSLFHSDGSASCAYVYPYRINGQRGEFYDEWANDQDFALYFALKLGIQ